jgi:hypothetical protein
LCINIYEISYSLPLALTYSKAFKEVCVLASFAGAKAAALATRVARIAVFIVLAFDLCNGLWRSID